MPRTPHPTTTIAYCGSARLDKVAGTHLLPFLAHARASCAAFMHCLGPAQPPSLALPARATLSHRVASPAPPSRAPPPSRAAAARRSRAPTLSRRRPTPSPPDGRRTPRGPDAPPSTPPPPPGVAARRRVTSLGTALPCTAAIPGAACARRSPARAAAAHRRRAPTLLRRHPTPAPPDGRRMPALNALPSAPSHRRAPRSLGTALLSRRR